LLLAAYTAVESSKVPQMSGTHRSRAAAPQACLQDFPDFSGRFLRGGDDCKTFCEDRQ
jgi:hypothetical protein